MSISPGRYWLQCDSLLQAMLLSAACERSTTVWAASYEARSVRPFLCGEQTGISSHRAPRSRAATLGRGESPGGSPCLDAAPKIKSARQQAYRHKTPSFPQRASPPAGRNSRQALRRDREYWRGCAKALKGATRRQQARCFLTLLPWDAPMATIISPGRQLSAVLQA